MLVENLSLVGAMLICPDLNQPFKSGHDFGDCELVLPGVGRVSVRPVIRWAMWPKIGVEFNRLSKQTRQGILQFINSVSKLSLSQRIVIIR